MLGSLNTEWEWRSTAHADGEIAGPDGAWYLVATHTVTIAHESAEGTINYPVIVCIWGRPRTGERTP